MRVIIDVVREVAALFTALGYGAEQLRRLVGSTVDASATSSTEPVALDAAQQLGEDYLLTTSISFNQQVVSNIDAIDAALIGTLGATAAFAVLAVDKIRELAVWPRWFAISLFALSAALSFVGYAYGFIRDQPGDVPRPAQFVADFARNGSKALARAIRAAVSASERNVRIRTRKRIIVLVAVGLLISGAVVMTYARLTGVVTSAPVAHFGGVVPS
jgi:glucan phosphoethanolaminetransferase (alkaline phosphatase superfamily)